METIKINEKEYVLKSDIEKKYILKSKKSKIGFDNIVVNLMDEAHIMGMGSCKLNESFKVVNIDINFLEKAIKSLKLISCLKQRDKITLAVSTDYPLCLGDIKGDSFSGILIAPRVDEK